MQTISVIERLTGKDITPLVSLTIHKGEVRVIDSLTKEDITWAIIFRID